MNQQEFVDNLHKLCDELHKRLQAKYPDDIVDVYLEPDHQPQFGVQAAARVVMSVLDVGTDVVVVNLNGDGSVSGCRDLTIYN